MLKRTLILTWRHETCRVSLQTPFPGNGLTGKRWKINIQNLSSFTHFSFFVYLLPGKMGLPSECAHVLCCPVNISVHFNLRVFTSSFRTLTVNIGSLFGVVWSESIVKSIYGKLRDHISLKVARLKKHNQIRLAKCIDGKVHDRMANWNKQTESDQIRPVYRWKSAWS